MIRQMSENDRVEFGWSITGELRRRVIWASAGMTIVVRMLALLTRFKDRLAALGA